MNQEDTHKLMMATYSALKSDFGFMGGLPYELADAIANVYWRYFEQTVESAPHITTEELSRRMAEFEYTRNLISAFQGLRSESMDKFHRDLSVFIYTSVCNLRIPNVERKSRARLMIERLFHKNQDIPNLVRKIELYQ